MPYTGAVERGERDISLDTLEKVVSALEVQPAELFRVENDLNEDETARRMAADEFSAIIGSLTAEQVNTLRRINREIKEAFE